MIAIKSTKELMFPPSYKGFVTMAIDLIQNKPNDSIYEMRIVDTVSKVVQEIDFVNKLDEEGKEVVDDNGNPIVEEITREVEKKLGNSVIRIKKMSYDELDQLASYLKVDMSDKDNLRENINELFRQGLLTITVGEIQRGEGLYFSDSPSDWEIIR